MEITKEQIETLLRDYDGALEEFECIKLDYEDEYDVVETFEYGYVRALQSAFCTLGIDYNGN